MAPPTSSIDGTPRPASTSSAPADSQPGAHASTSQRPCGTPSTRNTPSSPLRA
ncbi:MAG: hypothetical protein H6708_25055 [Kofleriaceae bacterium]|nr:hypothetical protein [Kofleriaceae bacterium]